jgi:hypothetical protein
MHLSLLRREQVRKSTAPLPTAALPSQAEIGGGKLAEPVWLTMEDVAVMSHSFL